MSYPNFPSFVDFNCPPDDPTYSLIIGDILTPAQEARLVPSRVVHVTIDPSVPRTDKTAPTTTEENEAVDPDRQITNARLATPADGLLSTPELVALFAGGAPLRSAYDDGLLKYQQSKSNIPTFGQRTEMAPTRRGYHEPEWTSYTHYWKTVLGMSPSELRASRAEQIADYIFILDPINSRSVVTGFLTPHRTEDLIPGLPQKETCGSDHVSLAVEFEFTEIKHE